MRNRQCFECRAGEHDNYAPIQGKFIVRDPETGKLYGKGYLCDDHVDALLTDGYKLQEDQA